MKLILFILPFFVIISCQGPSTAEPLNQGNYERHQNSLEENPYPLTKAKIQNILKRPPNPNGQQLIPETLHGCVSAPAKNFMQNLMVGQQSTGENCTVTVKPQNTVAISFLGNIDIPLADTATAKHSTDIFLNEIEDNGLVIIQHVKGRVVSATHTIYDQKGYAVYAGSGEGNFIKTCVFTSKPQEKQNCHSK